MITEDYVSFETAKLLKEKGFMDGAIVKFFASGYDENGNILDIRDTELKDYPRPTQQMAMKWLRKVHNLHCAVDCDFVLGWYCQITDLKETVEYDYEEMKHYHPDNSNGFSSPEEACEAAIKYCLERLI